MKEFPQKIKDFIKKVDWVFAKSYAETWSHEYIVKKRVDEKIFLVL